MAPGLPWPSSSEYAQSKLKVFVDQTITRAYDIAKKRVSATTQYKESIDELTATLRETIQTLGYDLFMSEAILSDIGISIGLEQKTKSGQSDATDFLTDTSANAIESQLSPLEKVEKSLIKLYLRKNNYKKSKTVKELNITINTLKAKMEKYGIKPELKKSK